MFLLLRNLLVLYLGYPGFTFYTLWTILRGHPSVFFTFFFCYRMDVTMDILPTWSFTCLSTFSVHLKIPRPKPMDLRARSTTWDYKCLFSCYCMDVFTFSLLCLWSLPCFLTITCTMDTISLATAWSTLFCFHIGYLLFSWTSRCITQCVYSIFIFAHPYLVGMSLF